MRSDKKVRIIRGPFGSGKSVGGIIEIARRAAIQPKCADGKRRSRWIVTRNTWPQLEKTTLKTFMEWLGPTGTWRASDKRFDMKFGDVRAEVYFMPLDRPENISNLLSLETNGGLIDEARDIPIDILYSLIGRLRYKSVLLPEEFHKDIYYGIWCSTNPPVIDSDWYNIMENPPKDFDIFVQPGGRDSDAENLENLPKDYYEDMVANNPPEWVEVYVDNKYGLGNAGRPVWRDFNYSLHVSKYPIQVPATDQLIIGMDFGLTPAAGILWQDAFGRINVVGECIAEDSGLERFLDSKLMPYLTRKFPHNSIFVVGDPSGVNRAQTDEATCFQMLKQKGFVAKPASTNNLTARLNAVENPLRRLIDGKPGFMVDKDECPKILSALRGGYRFEKLKDITGDNYKPQPKKDKHSHPADALQYGCLYIEEGTKKEERRAKYSTYNIKPWMPAENGVSY